MLGLEHFLRRLTEPFNAESRFYWPLVAGAFAAMAANVAWYYWKQRGEAAPAERDLRPWAVWINLIALVLVLVILLAKTTFLVILLLLALNVAALIYLYAFWLPPREAAWLREQRRQRYIPRAERRKRRRR